MNDVLGYAIAILGLSGLCVAWLLVQWWAARHTGRDTTACHTCDLSRTTARRCRRPAPRSPGASA
jgi:hypothetical protein